MSAIAKFFQLDLGPSIEIFNIWHILYLVLILGSIITTAILIRNKSEKVKTTILNVLAITLVCVYIADFFIMPLNRANDDTTRQLIDIDKLPFHLCTSVGVMVPFAQFTKKESKVCLAFKEIVSVLAIVSCLMYLSYPGSAIGDIGAFNYKVVQTFLFHGLLLAWGILRITTGATKLNIKNVWKPIVGILLIMAWATIGNFVYENEIYGISENWCFLRSSVFPFIPDNLMPLAFFLAVYSLCAAVYCTVLVVDVIKAKRKAKKEQSIQ